MLPSHDGLSAEEYEADLRTCLLHNLVRPEELKFAEEWLRKYEASLAAASSAKRDAREEETLAIAKEANSIARSQSAAAWRAARYAMYAAAIATTAAIVQAKDEILALIFTP